MNEVSTLPQPRYTAPPPADPILARSITGLILFTPDNGKPAELAGPPPPAVLESARKRAAALDDALDRHDADAARVAVAALLAIYAKGRDEADTIRATVLGYLATLRDMPAFAILGACAAWARGEAVGQNPGWAPTTDELRTAAQAVLRPWRIERARLAQFLNAKQIVKPPPSAEERARVAEGFAKALKELGGTKEDVSGERAARKAEVARHLDRLHLRNCEALGIDPEFGVTPALAERLKEMQQDER